MNVYELLLDGHFQFVYIFVLNRNPRPS